MEVTEKERKLNANLVVLTEAFKELRARFNRKEKEHHQKEMEWKEDMAKQAKAFEQREHDLVMEISQLRILARRQATRPMERADPPKSFFLGLGESVGKIFTPDSESSLMDGLMGRPRERHKDVEEEVLHLKAELDATLALTNEREVELFYAKEERQKIALELEELKKTEQHHRIRAKEAEEKLGRMELKLQKRQEEWGKHLGEARRKIMEMSKKMESLEQKKAEPPPSIQEEQELPPADETDAPPPLVRRPVSELGDEDLQVQLSLSMDVAWLQECHDELVRRGKKAKEVQQAEKSSPLVDGGPQPIHSLLPPVKVEEEPVTERTWGSASVPLPTNKSPLSWIEGKFKKKQDGFGKETAVDERDEDDGFVVLDDEMEGTYAPEKKTHRSLSRSLRAFVRPNASR